MDAARTKRRDETMKAYKKEIEDDRDRRLALEKEKEKIAEECARGKCPKKSSNTDEDMVTVRSTDHTGAVSEK